jgi:hypothetical protein
MAHKTYQKNERILLGAKIIYKEIAPHEIWFEFETDDTHC